MSKCGCVLFFPVTGILAPQASMRSRGYSILCVYVRVCVCVRAHVCVSARACAHVYVCVRDHANWDSSQGRVALQLLLPACLCTPGSSLSSGTSPHSTLPAPLVSQCGWREEREWWGLEEAKWAPDRLAWCLSQSYWESSPQAPFSQNTVITLLLESFLSIYLNLQVTLELVVCRHIQLCKTS